MSFWQVKKNGTTYAHGSKYTVPTAQQQRLIREGGYTIKIKQPKEDQSK